MSTKLFVSCMMMDCTGHSDVGAESSVSAKALLTKNLTKSTIEEHFLKLSVVLYQVY